MCQLELMLYISSSDDIDIMNLMLLLLTGNYNKYNYSIVCKTSLIYKIKKSCYNNNIGIFQN